MVKAFKKAFKPIKYAYIPYENEYCVLLSAKNKNGKTYYYGRYLSIKYKFDLYMFCEDELQDPRPSIRLYFGKLCWRIANLINTDHF